MKRAILLAAYGARNPSGREGLRVITHMCRERFPGAPIRWAFTSPLLREYMASQRQKSDSVRKALMRLYYEKYNAVVVQPLQTICGREHEGVRDASALASAESGISCEIGAPLLNENSDPFPVAKALLEFLPNERKASEDVIFMGHGAMHQAALYYSILGKQLEAIDPRVHVGAMKGATELEEIIPRLNSGKIWLLPLLSIVGSHALRDMAGSGESSWRSRIERAGFECRPVLKGMAECPQIAALWLDNLAEAWRRIL